MIDKIRKIVGETMKKFIVGMVLVCFLIANITTYPIYATNSETTEHMEITENQGGHPDIKSSELESETTTNPEQPSAEESTQDADAETTGDIEVETETEVAPEPAAPLEATEEGTEDGTENLLPEMKNEEASVADIVPAEKANLNNLVMPFSLTTTLAAITELQFVYTTTSVGDITTLYNSETLAAHSYITRIGYLMEYLGSNEKNASYVDVRFQGGIYAIARKDIAAFIPLSQIKSFPHYRNEGGYVVHYVEGNPLLANSWYLRATLGKAPSWMQQGKEYYSFSGIYFTDNKTKLGNYTQQTNAVNPTSPYYDYYVYQPMRTKTNYTAAQLNQAFASFNKGTTKMTNTGQNFIDAQNKYGVNALLMMAMGIHESNYGLSTFAVQRNNLFGVGAVDSDPGQAAWFSSIAAGIDEQGNYLSWVYADADYQYGTNYYGANLGNKSSGVNVKYASDPFWGEKIAQHYANIDRFLGEKDYNSYGLAIVAQGSNVYWGNNGSTYAHSYKSSTSLLTYMYPVALKDTNSWSKIALEPSYNKDKYVGARYPAGGTYNWYDGYVSKNNYIMVNAPTGNSNGGETAPNPVPNPNAKQGWVTEGTNRYYYVDGIKVTGWQGINGAFYYFNNDGVMHTGWIQDGANKKYLNTNGILVAGWQKIAGKWYYFNPDGAMITPGWQVIGGNRYYFNADGTMIESGWQAINGAFYYFNTDGTMHTSWIQDGANRKYLNANGILVAGWQTIEGKWYYFEADGSMITPGWQGINGAFYYFNSNGTMHTGWIQDGANKKYLNTSGILVAGWQTIEGKRYYFKADGAMITLGWQGINGAFYYFNNDGTMRTGWIQDGANKKYLNTNGILVAGWQTIEGKRYYFKADGAMITPGWQGINGAFYYFNTDGTMRTGWIQDGANKKYLRADGILVAGWQTIDGKWYYFKADGAMITPGWQGINGAFYYFNADGTMRTGWIQDGANKKYLNPSGILVAGWQTIEGKLYYFKADGAMVTGAITIAGISHRFGYDGVWLGTA